MGNEDPNNYPEDLEKKYHNINNMFSLIALEQEKIICDSIIKSKKAKNIDFYIWEKKRELIETKELKYKSNLEKDPTYLEIYKLYLKAEYEWELKLLFSVENKIGLEHVNQNCIKILKERIKRRIIIIKEFPQNNNNNKINFKFKGTKNNTIKYLTYLLNDRLEKSNRALKIFNKYKLIKQQKVCELIIKHINLELDVFKNFKIGDKIDIFQFKFLEIVISVIISSSIYLERIENLQNYITYFSIKKKDYEDLYSNIFDRSEVGYIEHIKERIEKCKNNLNQLNQSINIEWIPPLFIESEESEKSEDLPKNTIRIIYIDINDNKKRYLLLKLGKYSSIKIGQTKNGIANKFDWEFKEQDFKNIYDYTIHTSIYECSNDSDGYYFINSFDIKLLPLRDKSNFSYEYKTLNVQFILLIKVSDLFKDKLLNIKQKCPKYEFVDEFDEFNEFNEFDDFKNIENINNYNTPNFNQIINDNKITIDENVGIIGKNNNQKQNIKGVEKIEIIYYKSKLNNEVNHNQSLSSQNNNLKVTISDKNEEIDKEKKII